MTDPITPPPELVHKWALEAEDDHQPTVAYSLVGQIAAKAAQWGSDQELEACCAELPGLDDYLRAARRPKLWSLKEQALAALEVIPKLVGFENERDTIRRALEALDD
jgi:hypothetical protein